ncbi:MAG: class I SAM-dependent methyltransferase [Planctomycetota bacterium]
MPVSDGSYDRVLCLQVLHHIQDWRAAVGEVARVLRLGGQLLLAESLIGFLRHPILGRWMDHPTEDRFSLEDLLQELELHGFRILGTRGRGRWMTWLVAERVPLTGQPKGRAATPDGSGRSPDAPTPDPTQPPTIPGP